jgi:hypothetical protein
LLFIERKRERKKESVLKNGMDWARKRRRREDKPMELATHTNTHKQACGNTEKTGFIA